MVMTMMAIDCELNFPEVVVQEIIVGVEVAVVWEGVDQEAVDQVAEVDWEVVVVVLMDALVVIMKEAKE
jgi:hypothetical protein